MVELVQAPRLREHSQPMVAIFGLVEEQHQLLGMIYLLDSVLPVLVVLVSMVMRLIHRAHGLLVAAQFGWLVMSEAVWATI